VRVFLAFVVAFIFGLMGKHLLAGWTYADSFGTLNSRGQGEPAAKWNHYVRRRKWRHQENKTGGSAALDE
jgi:hypothetical protein